MKKIFALLLCAAAPALTTPPVASAQTSTTNAPAPVTQQTFFNSAQAYFTSFNTNFTWTSVKLEVSTGYKQVSGTGAANTLEAQYDFASRWTAGAAFQFSGFGTPLNVIEASGGYVVYRNYDAELELDARAGYDWNTKAAIFEPAVFIKKKLTENTYAGLGLSLPVETAGKFNRTPTFYLKTGFTF